MLSPTYCDIIVWVPFAIEFQTKIVGYCYHSVNVIKNAWPKSDHLRRLKNKEVIVGLRQSLCPSIYPSIHLSNYPHIHPSIHLSIPLSVYLSIYSPIYSFNYLSIYFSLLFLHRLASFFMRTFIES